MAEKRISVRGYINRTLRKQRQKTKKTKKKYSMDYRKTTHTKKLSHIARNNIKRRKEKEIEEIFKTMSDNSAKLISDTKPQVY